MPPVSLAMGGVSHTNVNAVANYETTSLSSSCSKSPCSTQMLAKETTVIPLIYDDDSALHEDSDCESDSNCDDAVVQNLTDQLSDWAVGEKATHTSVDHLLHILHPHLPELPLTARTLLNTGKHSVNLRAIEGGEYAHFGLLNGLKSAESEIIKSGVDVIQYQINIDGVPLFRSKGSQLWPILGKIVGMDSRPFVMGAFYGESKQRNVEEFLRPFITEALSLKNNGFDIQGIKLQAKLFCTVCDAPARASMRQIKSHTGYYGCERCTQQGEYLEGRVTFPQLDAEKRQDNIFEKKKNIMDTN